MKRVTYDVGGEGAVESWDGERLVLRAPRAFAPGSPIKFAIHFDEGAVAYESRSIGSKKRDDGAFDVRMRMVSLRRDDRVRLDSLR